MPWLLRMKRLEEVDRLPVWVFDDGTLRLQWRPRDEVLDTLMRCDNCGLWHTGVICHACQDHRDHAIYCASCSALEKLTVWEEVSWEEVLNGTQEKELDQGSNQETRRS